MSRNTRSLLHLGWSHQNRKMFTTEQKNFWKCAKRSFYLFISHQIVSQFNSYNVGCRPQPFLFHILPTFYFDLDPSGQAYPLTNRQLEAQCRELESKSARADPPVADTVSDEDEFEEIPSVKSAEATDPS